jgi:hypothetical protein
MLPPRGWVIGMVYARPVAVAAKAVAVGDISGYPHRIHPDYYWSAYLHRQLEADLVAYPEFLDLGPLSVRESEERDLAVTFDTAHTFQIVDLEPATDLSNGNVRSRADEPSKAGGTRAL